MNTDEIIKFVKSGPHGSQVVHWTGAYGGVDVEILWNDEDRFGYLELDEPEGATLRWDEGEDYAVNLLRGSMGFITPLEFCLYDAGDEITWPVVVRMVLDYIAANPRGV